MTRSPLLDDADFEAEVRGMLDRRAADVTPARPRVPAEVVLDAGRRSARPPARRRTWAAVAAAAAAVVVVAGLVATVGGGSGRDRATTADESSGGGAPEYPPLVVWPVVGDDALTGLVADPGDLAGTLAAPGTAAAAYLAEVAPAATADPAGAVLGPTGDTATVPWTFSDDGAPPAFTGTVHLRDAGRRGAPCGSWWARRRRACRWATSGVRRTACSSRSRCRARSRTRTSASASASTAGTCRWPATRCRRARPTPTCRPARSWRRGRTAA